MNNHEHVKPKKNTVQIYSINLLLVLDLSGLKNSAYHAAMHAGYVQTMNANSGLYRALLALKNSWFTLKLGAWVLALALSPSSYTPARWRTLAWHMHLSTWQVLGWFSALAALLSLVLIRIVLVTALSYGLSQYALQMVVRVLIIELIPLCAAMFVALRASLSASHLPYPTRARAPAIDPSTLTTQLMPRAVADAFAVVTLALVSSTLVLILTYLSQYGLSPWGLSGFTRTVGQVFSPSVSMSLILKILFFSWAVAIIPMAASWLNPQASGRMQPGSTLLFLVLFVLEAGFLAIKYI